jgi:GNAT superfamily N-acetyltransferase
VFKLELLSREHDRDSFDCGSEALNTYLKQTARQHTERGVSRTFVLVDEDARPPKPILGFLTLNLCQLKAEELPEQFARKHPREVTGIKLGRLAVAKNRQKEGIGKKLVIAAMHKYLEVFETAGGIGLFVDAKDAAAQAYYEKFGFVPHPHNALQLFLPLQTIRAEFGKAS